VKYAILGGSFNPIHSGHLFMADTALTRFGYDRVILVPAFQSPLKDSPQGSSPKDRLDMLSASIAGDPRLTIDDCELNREGVSYTIDTVKEIISRYEVEGKPGLIIGDDLTSSFHKWKGAEEIAELTEIIIARRLDSGTDLAAFPYPHKTLDNELINAASAEIRKKISSGEAWRYFVPPGARCIIEDRALYDFSGTRDEEKTAIENNIISETIVYVENEVRTCLEAERFKHSKNTALLSWDLCRRFGFDPQKGYLAGIAHDLCKDMEDNELIRLARSDGGGISKLEQKKPGLLHARAAAVYVNRKYGIKDKDILEAIRYHTTGVRDMGPIAKVVYIADKIEMSRTGVDPVLRKMSQESDLDTLFSEVLSDTVNYLKSRHLDISYGTRRLLAAMRKKNKP
jgi:nicotinate-nucleotide adenylyltransferase